MSTRDNIYENDHYKTFSKKSSRIQNDNTVHYPNKNEARLLRRIMASTGLSAEEVRGHYKYRRMLSEAQKRGQRPYGSSRYRDDKKEFYTRLIKRACKETGLVPQHPDTIVILQCLIDDEFQRGRWSWRSWMIDTNPLKAENAVKKYAK